MPHAGRSANAWAGLRWLMPGVAMAAAWVTLFYCLFFFEGYQKLFRDSDAGWHIRNGEAILMTGHLPRTDPYSFTRRGQPWFAWEWGSDVLAGAIDRASGLSGVALLYGVAIAAGVWLWFHLHWAAGGNFFLACAMAPLLLSTENIHWLARPHVVSWLFFVGALLYCERRRGAFRLREAIGIAGVTALWANLHASFFFAAVLALIYAAGAMVKPLIWEDAPPASAARPFLWAALIAAAAPLANPYGYRLYTHVFQYLTDRELLTRIGEYQAFRFHADGAGQIVAGLLLGVAGGVLALVYRRPERCLLAMVLAPLAFRSARMLPIAALLLLPLANAGITEWLATGAGFTRKVRAKLDEFLAYSARLRVFDARMNGFLVAPLVVLACFAMLRAPGVRAATGFSPADFPVAAYAHIPVGARLFAPDKFGGYLIYRSRGTFPVFFDGRSDLYGAEFMKQYIRAIELRPGWRAWWDGFHFTHALVPAGSPLAAALEASGWHPVYRDGTAVLLAGGGV